MTDDLYDWDAFDSQDRQRRGLTPKQQSDLGRQTWAEPEGWPPNLPFGLDVYGLTALVDEEGV